MIFCYLHYEHKHCMASNDFRAKHMCSVTEKLLKDLETHLDKPKSYVFCNFFMFMLDCKF